MASFDFWKRELNSDPEAIGKKLKFGDQVDAIRTSVSTQRSYTLAGIAPPGFFGASVGESPDFYIRLGVADLPSQDYWQSHGVTILARLKPGLSIAQAQASLVPLLEAVEKNSQIPEVERKEFFARALLVPAAHGISTARAKFSLPSRILTAVVGFLLLIACGNVANLVLARGGP